MKTSTITPLLGLSLLSFVVCEIVMESHDVRESLVTKDKLVGDGRFVKIESGIPETESKMTYNAEREEYNLYFDPKNEGKKSRLELTSCFLKESDEVIKKMSKIEHEAVMETAKDSRLPSLLVQHCPMANRPIRAIHSIRYQLRVDAAALSSRANYIITQWHGSPDPRIMQDTRCTARVSSEDLVKVCGPATRKCKKGVITSATRRGSTSKDTGLRYQQGGYPPLAMKIRDGNVSVIARSDERWFKPKGECSAYAGHQCKNFPRQQLHFLMNRNVSEVMTSQKWIGFEWKIKWSEYGVRKGDKESRGGDPGVLLSKAWIRLWVDGRKMIDWKGACGRNEQGRIPYFKIGVYNPSGNPNSFGMSIGRVEESYKEFGEISDREERDMIQHLVIRRDASELTRRDNVNRVNKKLRFYKKDGAYCKIQADV